MPYRKLTPEEKASRTARSREDYYYRFGGREKTHGRYLARKAITPPPAERKRIIFEEYFRKLRNEPEPAVLENFDKIWEW